MSKTNRIVRNTLVLNAGHIIAKLMNFALILILTQMLGSKGYGLYSFALAYVMMFMVFTQLGMNTFLVHDLAKDTSRAKPLPLAAELVVKRAPDYRNFQHLHVF